MEGSYLLIFICLNACSQYWAQVITKGLLQWGVLGRQT